MKKNTVPLTALIMIALVIVSCRLLAQATEPVAAQRGMVVCSDRNASEVGLKILKEGGNAMDAAVAMSFALAVTYPGAGNIGGGGFIVYYRNDGTITSIDFREKAPLHSNPTMFLDKDGNIRNNSNHAGILSVGVPGTVAGLELAHKKYGKLDWKKVVEPAVILAENGFRISESLSGDIQYFKDALSKYPSSFKVFMKNDGTVYLPGEIWHQPDLAKTLKRIQKYGQKDFYKGETARLICEFMNNNGGIINSDDLKKYKAIERAPIHGTYRGYDVYTMGPPSSGGVVLTEMLNILEEYDLKTMGHNSVPYLHLLTEVMRLAYSDRARYLGDADFNPDIPLKMMCSKEYASKLRNTIPMDQSSVSNPEDVEQVSESVHTTHLSVIDRDGNAVSLTYTIERWFGCKIVVEGAGFVLNNEMGDFNPIPGRTDNLGHIGTKPNLIAPEKRMLSSMCPTILLKDKRPFLIIGAPGGRTIPNTVLQVILNTIEFNMNIAEAVSQKRIHHQWMPDTTCFEKDVFSDVTRNLFEKMGHKTKMDKNLPNCEAMGILIDNKKNIIYGAADPRSPDGSAAGY